MAFRKIGCDSIKERGRFTQLGISKELGVSLSVVNGAVKELSAINAVRINKRSFEVIALDRLLLYWATHRNLGKDIVYRTRAEMTVKEIEREMPVGIAFTGYTAYIRLYGDAPADYSEVYAYAADSALGEVRRRFKPTAKKPNITILRCDRELEREIQEGKLRNLSVCPAQLFVDLWNMNEWYAKDFTDALSKRLGV